MFTRYPRSNYLPLTTIYTSTDNPSVNRSDFYWGFQLPESGSYLRNSDYYRAATFFIGPNTEFQWPNTKIEYFFIEYIILFVGLDTSNIIDWSRRLVLTKSNYTSLGSPSSIFNIQPEFPIEQTDGSITDPVGENSYRTGKNYTAHVWGWMYDNGTSELNTMKPSSEYGDYNWIIENQSSNSGHWEYSNIKLSESTSNYSSLKIVYLNKNWSWFPIGDIVIRFLIIGIVMDRIINARRKKKEADAQ